MTCAAVAAPGGGGMVTAGFSEDSSQRSIGRDVDSVVHVCVPRGCRLHGQRHEAALGLGLKELKLAAR